MKYKCIFRKKEKSLSWDTEANSADEALLKASEYAKENELFYRGFKEIEVHEFNGMSRIGIKFKSLDTTTEKESVNFLFVLAKSKEAAIQKYYNDYFGKSFKKVMTIGKGKNIYGNAIEAFYM